MGFINRLQHAWNVFTSRDPTQNQYYGYASSTRRDRPRLTVYNERTIISAIYNRISLDVGAININHARVDKNGAFVEVIDSYLNECLNVSANIDQSGRQLIQDLVLSMFDEGAVAVVPVETTINPTLSSGYDITNLRVGKILQWYPKHIDVRLYNEELGDFEDIKVPKATTAIIENPLYAVMNEQNSTLQRLIAKLSLLDAVDNQSGSGKLDMIIQLPFVIKSEARKAQAEERKKAIEDQLTNSKLGIAYIDGTEKVIQLNRPIVNNLMEQITYLTGVLYSQLGLTEGVFNGTASPEEMVNYYNRTIEPILAAIVCEFKRKFLTKTGRTQGQTIRYFQDPFRLAPVAQLAELADKFTRNEILSSNEFRNILGYKPSKDPKADELRNSNIAAAKQDVPNQNGGIGGNDEREDIPADS